MKIETANSPVKMYNHKLQKEQRERLKEAMAAVGKIGNNLLSKK